ncbi:hypothetical protein SBOR_5074 [Sclerotinia borealis F-4128]|uniref:Uncharacterized protein n=1 Tax=Sclerotinia borealis (strain F-4128) TaxID=1432307 RepID=W9CF89_SCLBF|nr:hypothetical protein SBOR_5074 [Sclerotinia borealis F-4128]
MTTVKPMTEERQHHSWGLLVQGRPATPSEGRAQQYTRIGPKDSQSLITHNNGTCLEFGPWDPVDEFDPTKPFNQQILLIDTTIKDIQSVRIRHNDVVGDDSDVFKGFRTVPYSGEVQLHRYPNGETYSQVPSYYASVSATPSMYSTANKSDVLGEAHPGLSSDTRFGVLVPNQQQGPGRGTSAYQRFDRPNNRGNNHGERGGYAQHLNRRGRRDAQFGRGQGRGDGRGHGHDGETRGGHHHESGGHHRNFDGGHSGHQNRDHEFESYRHREHQFQHHEHREHEFEPYRHREHESRPDQRWDDHAHHDTATRNHEGGNRVYDGYNGGGYPHVSMSHGQQAPIFPGYEEANPLIPPPEYRAGVMDYLPPLHYLQAAPANVGPFGLPSVYPPAIPNEVPVYGYTRIGGHNEPTHHSPVANVESHVGLRSPYFQPDYDVGIAVPMGPDQGRMATGPRPQVVLPPTTPGSQPFVGNPDDYAGFLVANVHLSRSFRPSPGRSPMRTTTDEGSPIMRPRRHATGPAIQYAQAYHARGGSGSGTDLRRMATAQSGFMIAEPRSSPSAGVFSPAQGSPRYGNMHSMTARSSPGVSFSNMNPVLSSMGRTASSDELSYAGFSISGQQAGAVSGPPTPPANPGRRWFETRQYVADGSRMSSPGFASSAYNGAYNGAFYANARSEDGRM